MIFLYTETSLHVGSGTSVGILDLPIQREKYTDFPIIQASGLKGAIREWFESKFKDDTDKRKIELTFGPDKIGSEEDAYASAVTFTDAHILLFPVRSLKGIFAYCTSPTVLERFRRYVQIAESTINWDVPAIPNDRTVLGVQENCDLADDDQVLLEEYAFKFMPEQNVSEIASWLSQQAFPNGDEYKFWREKVKKSLLVLPDNAFRDFIKFSTEVQARIKIKNETRTVEKGALFYEESLLPDSLLYSLILVHDPMKDDRIELSDDEAVLKFLSAINSKRLQLGGGATIGKGIVNVKLYKGDNKLEEG